jgi:hypothetical protein
VRNYGCARARGLGKQGTCVQNVSIFGAVGLVTTLACSSPFMRVFRVNFYHFYSTDQSFGCSSTRFVAYAR